MCTQRIRFDLCCFDKIQSGSRHRNLGVFRIARHHKHRILRHRQLLLFHPMHIVGIEWHLCRCRFWQNPTCNLGNGHPQCHACQYHMEYNWTIHRLWLLRPMNRWNKGFFVLVLSSTSMANNFCRTAVQIRHCIDRECISNTKLAPEYYAHNLWGSHGKKQLDHPSQSDTCLRRNRHTVHQLYRLHRQYTGRCRQWKIDQHCNHCTLSRRSNWILC